MLSNKENPDPFSRDPDFFEYRTPISKAVTKMMNQQNTLKLVKLIHTLIWLFFNVVIFYMLYAVITDKIDIWLWVGFGLVALEGLTLLLFKFYCPLTLIARKYSDSTKDNFDIYLPNWLAKYTKLIYTSIMGIIAILTVFRLIQ